MTDAELVELTHLRAWKARVEPVIHRIYDVLYWDGDLGAFDPDKQWDSDFIEMIADEARDLYGTPADGTVDYPKIKGL